MKVAVIALVLTLGAIGAANAQTPSMDAVKACVAKMSAAYPLSLGQNIAQGGWFWLDACLRGQN